jgi:hypothetical protein
VELSYGHHILWKIFRDLFKVWITVLQCTFPRTHYTTILVNHRQLVHTRYVTICTQSRTHTRARAHLCRPTRIVPTSTVREGTMHMWEASPNSRVRTCLLNRLRQGRTARIASAACNRGQFVNYLRLRAHWRTSAIRALQRLGNAESLESLNRMCPRR